MQRIAGWLMVISVLGGFCALIAVAAGWMGLVIFLGSIAISAVLVIGVGLVSGLDVRDIFK